MAISSLPLWSICRAITQFIQLTTFLVAIVQHIFGVFLIKNVRVISTDEVVQSTERIRDTCLNVHRILWRQLENAPLVPQHSEDVFDDVVKRCMPVVE
jgi:hypothetical protein